MKTIICDICHAVGAGSYTYARELTKYSDYEKKIPDYEVDLCTTCAVKLYRNLLRQLHLSGGKLISGLLQIEDHINSIKTLVKCPATDQSKC